MAAIMQWFEQDLREPVIVNYSRSTAFSTDNNSLVVGVRVYDDGAAAALSGNVVCHVIRDADGGTVTFNGTLSGNSVSATLPAACFAYAGPIAVMLQLVSGATKTTLSKVVYNVAQGSTDTPIDPGSVVPNIDDLLAQISRMEQATDAAEAAADNAISNFAGEFSTSTAYTAGQYVTYTDGKFYRFTVDHAAGAWTGSDVVAATMGGEIGDLKSALTNTLTLDFTKAKRLAQNTDFNTLSLGNYYVGSAREAQTMVNAPSALGGRLTVMETYSSSNNHIQIYFDSEQGVYWRVGNLAAYHQWSKSATVDDTNTAISSSVTALSNTVNKYSEPTSDFISQNNGILANINDDVMFLATASSWSDTPTTKSGVFYTRRYSTHYKQQIFYELTTGNSYERLVNYTNNIVYRNWTQQNGLPPLKILALGDSICNGYRNDRKGFVGDLGLPYKNIGVSGASLSTVVTTAKNIPQQLIDETEYNPDIIIADGGINDYMQNAPLGTISTAPVVNDTEANALDKTTVIGGLSYLFYQMIKKFPKAQRFFVITHKTKRQDQYGNWYAPTRMNTEGYTQQGLHDAIVSVCNLYNVKVIDVYTEGIINTIYPQYVSPTPYAEDSSVNDEYYVDADGIHPLAYGYMQGYIPMIRKAIGVGTAK